MERALSQTTEVKTVDVDLSKQSEYWSDVADTIFDCNYYSHIDVAQFKSFCSSEYLLVKRQKELCAQPT